MPKDLLEIALRKQDLADQAMDNPDVANTFCSIVDRLLVLFRDKTDLLEIGPPESSEDGFIRFKLGGR